VNRRTLATAVLLSLSCLALLPTAASAALFWSSGGVVSTPETIGRAELDGSGVDPTFILLKEETEPAGVAVEGEYVYWTEFFGAIGRAKLDGSEVESTFITLSGQVDGIAVDSGHIYWANVNSESIGRANIDGTGVDEGFIKAGKLDELEAIDIAVDGNHVYWTNTDLNSIGRANMNGHGVEQEFVPGVGVPWTLDVDSEHIYWANRDSGKAAIGRANLDGTGVDPSYIPLAAEPFGLVVDGVHVYWTSEASSVARVGRAGLDGSEVEEAFIGGLAQGIGFLAAEVTPLAKATPASLTFGSPTPVPQESISPPQTVTYTNGGNLPLTISGFTLSGPDPDEFLTGTDTCREALAPAASCTLQVRFAPLAPGTATATLTALTNAEVDPTTALSGIATSSPIGPAGPPGPVGPVGPTGKAGPRGPAGRNAKVTCRVKRKKLRKGKIRVKVTCRVRLIGKKKARLAWRLTHRQRTVASGVARARNGFLMLPLSRITRLHRGRYVLHLAGRRQGAAFVVR
jgi:hypothetical protein